MLPAQAGASADAPSALHAYARARLAEGYVAQQAAIDSYRSALTRDPTSVEIAGRAYAQAVEGGDRALALRSARLLDAQGLLPRDGTLLLIDAALETRDWTGARALADRLVTEGNFAFLAPVLRSWIAYGEGRDEVPVVDPNDRFAALARRYVDEHMAFEALARGDVRAASPFVLSALAQRSADGPIMRIAFATRLAAQGGKAEALALLPAGDSIYTRARTLIQRGKDRRAHAAALTPRQGFARLLARLATDLSSEGTGSVLGMRLARLATFADARSPETLLVAVRLLTQNDRAEPAIDLARSVPQDGPYGLLAQIMLVEALAADDQKGEALELARTMAAAPDADTDRYVKLGQLLADSDDYAGAAQAFRDAQKRYPGPTPPWTLFLFEGSALEQAGRWDESLVALNRAAALAPQEPVVLNYLGYAQIERRLNIQAALALLSRASALRPQDPAITDSLGWAKFLTGDVQGAISILERAAMGAPTDPTINEHLGDALWAAGRRVEARYAWRAAAVFADGKVAERLQAKTREGMKPEYAAP